jgi:peptidoglycan hydrolase-like amidase
MMQQPIIKVGIIDGTPEIRIKLHDLFMLKQTNSLIQGNCLIRADIGGFVLYGEEDNGYIESREITLAPRAKATFSIKEVKIGINFHWERKEEQTFHGDLRVIKRDDGLMAVINQIPLEEYLVSVISSEMGAGAPLEFLKAHAIASRSWLAAMLARRDRELSRQSRREIVSDDLIVRWYEREDHELFDVCADDHCQRYQGISKVISANAVRAVKETRGVFLVYDEEICDARFFKACGGLSDRYENTWEDRYVPYLTEVSDSLVPYRMIDSEDDAIKWINSSPDVFCNINDHSLLNTILPDFDRDTNFFRWEVDYERTELERILKEKSGIDFGTLHAIEPLERGPSGRIIRLRIVGSERSVEVGKELEIRRWLSPTHLLSSAFFVSTESGPDGFPSRFIIKGAGLGHGVGMCQIGAAAMAAEGIKVEHILKHYFPGSQLRKLYY